MNILLSKEFVPLYQTMIWVLLIIAVLIIYKKEFASIRKAMLKRLDSGAQVKFGGFELGAQSQIMDESKLLELVKQTISEVLISSQELNNTTNAERLGNKNEYINKVAEKVKTTINNKVITIDSESINKEKWYFYYQDNKTVQDLLNAVWSNLRDFFGTYTYGIEWELLYSKNNGPYKEIPFIDSTAINTHKDIRTLKDVGVQPGDKFKVRAI